MKSNQKKYLDKVVDIILKDTEIDYDQERIRFSFLSNHLILYTSSFTLYQRLFPPFRYRFTHSFSQYGKDTYGLDGDEIEYVWNKYKDMLKEKIK